MAGVNLERELVVTMLMEVSQDDRFSHLVLRDTLAKYQYLTKQQRSFITRLFEGTIENKIQIDYWINGISSIKVDKMKPLICEIIRSGVYQIVYMDSIPDSAACNEAVKLAQKHGFYNLKSFVNGVLRNVSRRKHELPLPSMEFPDEYLSVRYSMPYPLVRRWSMTYGLETTEKMLQAFLEPRPTTVRVRGFRNDINDTIAMLREEGVSVSKAPYLPYALELKDYNYLQALRAFREGRIQVQDISSMLVGEVASPRESDRILDLCAAPGGKSLHVADKLNGTGWVEARDLSDRKVDLIRDNAQRAGLVNFDAKTADATVYDKTCREAFDIVLADLPCSGLGVIGRKADIKYRVTADGIRELAALQRSILANAADYVKPGGTLVYSTCTISREENQENVAWFASRFPFELESLDPYLPEELHNGDTAAGYLQLLPGIHRSDGFFIARLKKKYDYETIHEV